MATKSKKKPTYTKNPGLSQAKAPTLIRQSGERVMAQSELAQLQDKREKLATELDEIDQQILGLKKKRKEELLEELKALGLDVVPKAATTAGNGNTRKKKGRPQGFKMSDAQKQAMRDGRAKAKAEREARAASA